ncbi:transposase [Alicyclobacillus tolerans]|nr:transposase [Alicyclobacillus montanus]
MTGRVASQVARDLGISEKTLYGWIARYKNDPKHLVFDSSNVMEL